VYRGLMPPLLQKTTSMSLMFGLFGSYSRWLSSVRARSALALRWCLDFDAISVIIPGAKNPAYAQANARASSLPPLGAELHVKLAAFYEREVAAHIRGPY